MAALLLGLSGRITAGALAALAAGFAIPPIVFLLEFGSRHAIADLYQATIAYNLQYSGETYAGPMQPLVYLLTFPIRHARVDGLWLVGCGGCAVLLLSSFRDRLRLLPVAWVAAACIAIAVNGSRICRNTSSRLHRARARRRVGRARPLVAASRSSMRPRSFSSVTASGGSTTSEARGQHLARCPMRRRPHDTRRSPRARYGEPGERKYSAILVERLAELLKTHG